MKNKNNQNSGKEKKRTRISDIRQAELISATLKCIAEKGSDRVTLDDVTREAGFSQGIALYYFKNKETLISAAIESIWGDLMQLTRDVFKISGDTEEEQDILSYIKKLYSDPDIDLISIIRDGLRFILEWFEENPYTISVALEFWSQIPRNSRISQLKDTFQPYIRNITAMVLQEGIKRGIFKKRNVQVAAHTLLSVITGFAVGLITTDDDVFDVKNLEEDYIDLIFSYLCV